MNYFSYFSEIEDTFIRRRGKHLLLSPIDWALIESWKERGVPLHVALRGIEHAFDSHQAKKRKRSVKSLAYCQEEVEAQYAEWLESRVGSHEGSEHEGEAAQPASPFPREAVVGYLSQSLEQLRELSEQRTKKQDEVSEALSSAVALISEIKNDYASAALPDSRKLEESLTGIERKLNQALISATSAEELERLRGEIEQQLRPYRKHMDQPVYRQTFDNLLLKRLRENFGVPRLSLFYL